MNKIANKHTVDYQPSPSQLISEIHILIFLWTPKGFISPKSLLNFFAKSVYSAKVVEKFQSYSVKITANTFASQKNRICSFLILPSSKTLPRIFIIILQADGN